MVVGSRAHGLAPSTRRWLGTACQPAARQLSLLLLDATNPRCGA
jgi:hypothetical protein